MIRPYKTSACNLFIAFQSQPTFKFLRCPSLNLEHKEHIKPNYLVADTPLLSQEQIEQKKNCYTIARYYQRPKREHYYFLQAYCKVVNQF